MSTSIRPFAVQAGEGARLSTPSGDLAQVKTNSSNTNGSLSVIELRHEPRSGPALHTHANEDEVWWVLEGEYRFKAGDDMFRLSEGGMAFGPRGIAHCFQNVGDSPARMLIVTTPAGAERFFEEFADLPPGPRNYEDLNAFARAHGIEFVGPPLEVSDPL